MSKATVIVVHSDLSVAQELADNLQSFFGSALELRTLLLSQEIRGVMLDLESVKVEEIRQLARDFHNLTIVCTHNSQNERMWIAVLEAGAAELCYTLDLNSMIRVLRV